MNNYVDKFFINANKHSPYYIIINYALYLRV